VGFTTSHERTAVSIDGWTLAGWFAASAADRGARSAKVLPERIVSASPCVCPRPASSMRRTLASAQESAPRGVSHVVGVGVRAPDVDAMLRAADAAAGETTDIGLLREAIGFEADPSDGYEILSWDGGIRHSWLCIALEARAFVDHAIVPGPHGLLRSLADADALVALLRDGRVPAEPGYWFAARVRVVGDEAAPRSRR
jgi:hypothetical protein